MKVGVLLIEIVAPDSKPDGNAENRYDDGIRPFGYCRPYSTVDDAIHPFPESFRRFLQALGLAAELAADSFMSFMLKDTTLLSSCFFNDASGWIAFS